MLKNQQSEIMLPSKNILLVDDNPVILKILSKWLGDKCPNFNLTMITNSIKAMELVKNKHKAYFDLILTDIEMPEVTGIELTRYIREDLDISKNDLPILVYSAREDLETIKRAKLAGCNDYYANPKNNDSLVRNISKWVLNDYIPSKDSKQNDLIINDKILKGCNIVIAYDQLINMAFIAKKLRNSGANIVKCSKGNDITDLIQKDSTKYHLIITDINMSEIGGIEAVKEVRKIQEKYNREHGLNQRVPIISLSDSNKKEFIMELLNNDIDDYLTKNCSGEDVIRLVKFWIDY